MINYISKKYFLPSVFVLGTLLLLFIWKTEYRGKSIRTTINCHEFDEMARDFFQYKCESRRRFGGVPIELENYKGKDTNESMHIDGAWFVCLDAGLAPVKDHCTVLSLGINVDPSFDEAMNSAYGCRVDSFDPFIEAERFAAIRRSDSKLQKAATIKVNDKWHFHRVGIVSATQLGSSGQFTIEQMVSLSHAISQVGLENKTIDVLKMDIDCYEWAFFETLDLDYMCKHVKQLMFETHPVCNPQSPKVKQANMLLRRLEKCFRLFHRNTRFFGWKDPRPDILVHTGGDYYEHTTNLIEYMVTFGELYFINQNFIQSH